MNFWKAHNLFHRKGNTALKIIVTNDDGIEAPGIQALYEALKDFSDPIIVAPAKPQSEMSHRVTTKAPLRIKKIAENRYSVDGTPADCTRIALTRIAPDASWLFSGINSGANLGPDVYVSGTVAASREASFFGCRAIAISQYISRNNPIDWDITRHQTAPLVRRLIRHNLDAGHFLNVNLPHPIQYDSRLEMEFCEVDTLPHNFSYQQNGDELIYVHDYHKRPRLPGHDVDVCFSGKISVTCMTVGT